MIIDYVTPDMNDDIIQAFSNPVGCSQSGGLSDTNPDLSQPRFDSIQTASRTDFSNPPNFFGVFSFSGSVQAVPEPGPVALLGVATAGPGLLALKRKRLL